MVDANRESNNDVFRSRASYISCSRRSVAVCIMDQKIKAFRHGHFLRHHVRLALVPPPTTSVPARSSLQDSVLLRWPNLRGIAPQTNGFIPFAQGWPAMTAGLGSMPKFKNTALISSTITLIGSSHKQSNLSKSRSSTCRATPLISRRRPIIELVKTPNRRRHPQTKGKFAVPSSSRLRSVLTASIEVRVSDATLVEAYLALRNRKRKMIKLSRQMPLHKLLLMQETRKTLSRGRYRLAHNSSSLQPPTRNYLQLSKSPIRRNRWSNQHRNPNRQSNCPMFDHLVLNQNHGKKRSLLMRLSMVHPLPHQCRP